MVARPRNPGVVWQTRLARDGSSTQSITNTVDEIIDDFVIPDNLREDEETHKLARRLIQEAEARIEVETDEEEEDFHETEIATAIEKFHPNKTPGTDNITIKMIKAVWEVRPGIIQNIFNKCKEQRKFPVRWKRGKLVLIPKQDEDLTRQGAYRLICLLPCMGKIYERL